MTTEFARRTLVIDTATAACSVALFDGADLVAERNEVLGRGHAERLVPLIAELPQSGRAGTILVDIGPGSFTGLRVGIAAAIGLGIGWGAQVHGFSSLALVAAGGIDAAGGAPLAVLLEGGHGEVYMQRFATAPLSPLDDPRSLAPLVALADAAGHGLRGDARSGMDAVPLVFAHPRAADAMLLPHALRALPPRPFYVRAPDARLPG